METGELRVTLNKRCKWVRALAFSPDGETLALASSKTIKLLDTATGGLRQTLEGHTGWINAVAFSPDGENLASGSLDCTIRLWTIRAEKDEAC